MKLLLTQVIILGLAQSAKNSPKSRVESVSDHKEFKKVLRTKNNVLTLFINNQKKSGELAKTLDEVSVEVKGLATILTVDCNDKDGKKLCKKLKISAEPAHVIKHFKDGDFHKDYDRALKSKSLVTFLKDPAGELPWEEDPAAQDVAHIANPKQFSALLKSEKGPVLTMFYAPWCGHCKSMKADYSKAAKQLTEENVSHVLATVDATVETELAKRFEIRGYPTLKFFRRGQMVEDYRGGRTKTDLVKYIRGKAGQAKDEL